MRILFFSRHYTSHDRRFLESIAAREIEVHFLRFENDGARYESRPLPASVHPVAWEGDDRPCGGPERWLALLPSLERAMNRVAPDVVHAGPIPSCGFLAAVLDRRPLLAMSWGSDLLREAASDSQTEWRARYALERADMVACDATAVRRKAQQIAPVTDDRFIQFPWGVDLRHFTPGTDASIRRRLGWEGKRILLSTRAWEPLYGIEVLLEGFRLVSSESADLCLLLLSSGSQQPQIEEFVNRHHLADRIHMPGQISTDRALPYFRAADVYISCAHSDGTSISLLEAMAVGLPVIVTDIDSNREWVEGGVNGWLAADSNPQAVRDAILTAIAMPESERRALALRNRAVVEQRADWQQSMDLLVKSYRALAGGRRS